MPSPLESTMTRRLPSIDVSHMCPDSSVLQTSSIEAGGARSGHQALASAVTWAWCRPSSAGGNCAGLTGLAGEVMSQTHHRSAESIAGYVREADLFRHTSARRLGL